MRVCDVRKTADSFDPVANLIQEGRKRMTRHLVRFGGATAIATILLFRPAATDAAVLLPGSVVAPNVLSGAAGTLVDSVTAPLRLASAASRLPSSRTRSAPSTSTTRSPITPDLAVNFTSTANLLFRSVTEIFATSVFYRTDNGGLGIFGSGNAGGYAGICESRPLWHCRDVWFRGHADKSRRNIARARDSHECDRLRPWFLVRGGPLRERRLNVWP